MIRRGDICWADLAEPVGSEPGFRRPVLVVQSDAYNRSRLSTTIVVVLTSNLARARVPGNVFLDRGATGLPKDSVAVVTSLVTVDRAVLEPPVATLDEDRFDEVLAGLRLVLG